MGENKGGNPFFLKTKCKWGLFPTVSSEFRCRPHLFFSRECFQVDVLYAGDAGRRTLSRMQRSRLLLADGGSACTAPSTTPCKRTLAACCTRQQQGSQSVFRSRRTALPSNQPTAAHLWNNAAIL